MKNRLTVYCYIREDKDDEDYAWNYVHEMYDLRRMQGLKNTSITKSLLTIFLKKIITSTMVLYSVLRKKNIFTIYILSSIKLLNPFSFFKTSSLLYNLD